MYYAWDIDTDIFPPHWKDLVEAVGEAIEKLPTFDPQLSHETVSMKAEVSIQYKIIHFT